MSIAALLQAAEYLERREREAEHGYASSLPVPMEKRSSSASPVTRTKVKKSQGSRSTHNELEKNRRAHLRVCLEKLKDLVPLAPDSARHTTLGLLTRAKNFIKTLEDRNRRIMSQKDQLNREQRFLRRKLEQLSHFHLRQMNKRRNNSLSECSTSTTSSASSTSENDEVDVIGYGSHGSDVDDQLSVQSGSSDSGIVLSSSVASIGHFPQLSLADHL